MMHRTRAFLFLSSGIAVAAGMAATAACGSSSSSDQNTSARAEERDKAHAYYVERVHNGVTACVQCHAGTAGPRFMAQEAEESYATIEKTVGLIAAPRNSPL